MVVTGMDADFDVTTRGEAVEVKGYDRDEVIEALRLREVYRTVRGETIAGVKERLLQAMMVNGIPLISPASLTQAQRLASLRQALLTTPAFTNETLAELRGESVPATRTWVSRRRNKGRLFTVSDGGRTVIPAFQFDDRGETRGDLAGVLEPLLRARLDGWAIWSWLTRPTGRLSGEVPEVVAASNPKRAATAAQRFTEQFVRPGG